MDVKDLRTESALSERNNDGSKYTQGGVALQCNRNKLYQDIGSNPLAKTEPAQVRPCAVIGPDRVVPPPAPNDTYLKKGSVEPWPSPDHVYRRPPEYPHKLSNLNPSRNISPRQTFQENMQRIMVPPTYSALRHSDDANFNHQDRNMSISKNVKPNMAPEAKYCEVPYAMNTLANEPKNIRDPEMYVPSVNSSVTRPVPHGWPPASVNVHAPRTYGAHELYQYPQYPSCASQRPTVVPMTRPHRTIQEDPVYVYPEQYYQDSSARFKAFPPVKERYPQSRFEYISSTNYPSPFHPPPPTQPHKYDIPKPSQAHPYSMYPHLKYLDNRAPEHSMEGYPRPTNTHPHYNIQFRNQVIQSTFAPLPGSNSQSKVHPYPPDGAIKSVSSNKLAYDNNSKMYIDFENARTKTYPITDNYFVNEMGRVHAVKNQMVIPNYPSIGMHSMPPQQYYRKDSSQMKPLEYLPHFRNFEPSMNNNAMLRHAPQFSPSTLTISPTDSSASNDMSHGISQEDCGYVSQSSTASVRSIDSGIYRLPNEYYNKRYDFRYGPIVGSSHTLSKSDLNSNTSKDNKQKQIDVRQFFQMWNEGEEENCENSNSKEIVVQTGSSDMSNFPKQHGSNQDQLYVLGLVNVPSEELSKYEHIQKISKLPENIKGYNSLELLSQFEEAIESSHTNSFKSIPREYQMSPKAKTPKQGLEALPRPVSPLDVEAKISQSVIHKEVGCNFEIRPCSPKMLNVEVAAPAQNILGERIIEKVTNPLSKTVKSPKPMKPDENSNCHSITRQENAFTMNENPSCKMIRSPYATSNMDSVKTNYSMQDLEINSGVCLASLPRLDNEIELNFPEVNQQFINANKQGAVTSTTRNSSSKNTEQEAGLTDNGFKNDIEQGDNALIADEGEKAFTKLSKYRKLKANTADNSENNQSSMAVRTDSVIIKNPENIKNIEDKLLENNLNIPINLSSQSSVCHVPNFDLSEKLDEQKNNNDEIALDFSLNKSGNGLPMIDVEKDDLPKSFSANQPNISCDNVSLADQNSGSCNTNFSDDVILNSKESIPKCIEVESNKCTSIEKNKEAKSSHEANFDEETIKSVADDNNQTSVLDNSFANKHLIINSNADTDSENINNDKQLSECLQTCQDIEIANFEKRTRDITYYDTHEDTNNIDIEDNSPKIYENINNIVSPLTEIVSNCEESAEIMQLISSSNENQVTDTKSKFVIPFQNKNDFDNDEISAKLEKIFQESSEDTTLPNNCDFLDASSVAISTKSFCHRQRKELYSPWIQKLLLYNEGLCSDNEVKTTQTESIHSILIDDKYKLQQTNKNNVLEENQSQEMDVDEHTDMISNSLDNTTHNKVCINKAIEVLAADAECNTIAGLPYTTKDLNACFDRNKKSLQNIIVDKLNVEVEDIQTISNQEKGQNEPKQIKLELQTINNDRSCDLEDNLSSLKEFNTDKSSKKSPQKLNVKSRKTDINRCELNTFQASEESETELFHCDTLSNVEGRIENQTQLTYNVTRDKEIYGGSRRNSEGDNIIHKDLTTLNNSNFIASNYQYQTGYSKCENGVIENVNINDIDYTCEASDKNEIGGLIKNVINGDMETCAASEKSPKLIESVISNLDSDDAKEVSEDNPSEDILSKNVIPHRDREIDEALKENQMSPLIENDKNCYSDINATLEEDHRSLIEDENVTYSNNDADETLEEKLVVISTIKNVITKRDMEICERTEKCQSKDSLMENDIDNHHSYTDETLVQNQTEKDLITNRDISDDNKSELQFCENTILNHATVEISEENQSAEIVISNFGNIETKSSEKCGGPVKENLIKSDKTETTEDDHSEKAMIDIVITNHDDIGIAQESETYEALKDRKEQNLSENYITNHDVIGNVMTTYECCDTVDTLEVSRNVETLAKTVITNNCECDSGRVPEGKQIDETVNENMNKNRNNDMDEETENNQVRESTMTIELINRDIDSCESAETFDNSKVNTEFKIIVKRNGDDSCYKSFINSVSDNCISQQSDNRQPEENCIKTETVNNVCVSSKVGDISKDNIIKENISNPIVDNVSDCVSNKWTEHQTEVDSLLSDSDNGTEAKAQLPLEVCDYNVDNLRYQNQAVNKVSNSEKPENYILDSSVKRWRPLKRSFSDSALNTYKNRDATDRPDIDNTPLIWPSKRQRMYQLETPEQHVINESLCSIIQNNRRNSVSSFYNEENVSICILIDNNCIIAEENEEEKICYAEISEDCIAEINTTNEEDDVGELICSSQENEIDFSESAVLDYDNEKTIQESWLDDVACVETVVSDDIVEDIVVSAHTSPRDIEVPGYNESAFFNCDISEHTVDDMAINEEIIPSNDTEIIEAYPHTHMDVIMDKMHSNVASEDTKLINNLCRDDIISGSNCSEFSPSSKLDYTESVFLPDDNTNPEMPEDKENIFKENLILQKYENDSNHNSMNSGNDEIHVSEDMNPSATSCNIPHDDVVQSRESSIDTIFGYKEHCEDVNNKTSSSPEVSSTTSEEKSSCILLKITNYNGSRVSEVNEVSHNRPRCKFTENKEYSNSYGTFPKRPLLTKAAQKYIPPLKESIRDLKVKLSLPQQKLLKLKQLKMSRSEPKINKQTKPMSTIPKKPKPNFEDVLKNIDEVQIKMHKEKSKKVKNIVPKVVIKKNINGSHYTSSSNKDIFNPDLTGRKWQPWVFLEKNPFIDKMAIRNETKAIFSHRKNTYVLAEKFKKYKSVSNCSAKFVITQPKSGDMSKGQLKYTIRLKHSY